MTDRGTEFCGQPERHDYQLYLAINDIEHTRTKAYSPQANGICERFRRTVKEEFYEVAFRKKVYATLDQLRTDLDIWVEHYKNERKMNAPIRAKCAVAGQPCRRYVMDGRYGMKGQ